MTEKKSPENHLLILRDVVAERKKEAPTPASKKKYDDREEAQETIIGYGAEYTDRPRGSIKLNKD